VNGDGVDDLWDAIESHRKHQESAGSIGRKRAARLRAEVEEIVSQRLKGEVAGLLEEDLDLASKVAEREVDPYGAADELIRHLRRR